MRSFHRRSILLAACSSAVLLTQACNNPPWGGRLRGTYFVVDRQSHRITGHAQDPTLIPPRDQFDETSAQIKTARIGGNTGEARVQFRPDSMRAYLDISCWSDANAVPGGQNQPARTEGAAATHAEQTIIVSETAAWDVQASIGWDISATWPRAGAQYEWKVKITDHGGAVLVDWKQPIDQLTSPPNQSKRPPPGNDPEKHSTVLTLQRGMRYKIECDAGTMAWTHRVMDPPVVTFPVGRGRAHVFVSLLKQ